MDREIKKKLASNWFKLLQNIICDDIEKIENKKIKFESKTWNRSKIKDEGGGEFRILKNGKIFEKVGVNFSEVYGKLSKEMMGKIPGANKNLNFWASGISVVMHMNNPYVPAIHFNTRFIYTTHGWFGGGMDVTPCIVDNKEKTFLHKELKKCVIDIIKNIIKNIKNGVMIIFIYHTEKKPEVLEVFFLIIKKIIGKKTSNLYLI